MITEALQHCRGIGPIRLRQLHELGIRTWQDALSRLDSVPTGLQESVQQECQRSQQAYADDRIDYFVERLYPQDRWRILHQYIDHATYFDIETTGLELDSRISVIVCWHRGQLQVFTEGENLDEFLDLLDDVRLLVSFNGSTFDVPRVLDAFHIPGLPCPHLDLRWPCYYRNLNGGLKQISGSLGIHRPPDLSDADGELAVLLWNRWEQTQDAACLAMLIRYCAADVLLLKPLAQHLAGLPAVSADELWKLLPASAPVSPSDLSVAGELSSQSSLLPSNEQHNRRQELAHKFGSAGPAQLRTLRGRLR